MPPRPLEAIAGVAAPLRGHGTKGGDRRGTPEIFDTAVREQILAGGADVGCRQWQAAQPAAVAHFDTDNRRYSVDIDTAADLDRLQRETRRALRWPAAAVV